jgi:hypothetical protein
MPAATAWKTPDEWSEEQKTRKKEEEHYCPLRPCLRSPLAPVHLAGNKCLRYLPSDVLELRSYEVMLWCGMYVSYPLCLIGSLGSVVKRLQ